MKTIVNCGIVGYGNVNRGLAARLRPMSWNIRWICKSSGVYSGDLQKIAEREALFGETFLENLDVVFVAIPSVGEGRQAYDYYRHFLRNRIPVVACEKAALAHFAYRLRRYERNFRYNASVGGNSNIVSLLSEAKFKTVEVCGVFNVTLSFLRQLVKKGFSLLDAIKRAQQCGLTEPGANDPEVILNGELRDTLLKMVILFNVVTRKTRKWRPLILSQLDVPSLPFASFEEALKAGCLCVTSVSQGPLEPRAENSFLRKVLFRKRIGGWNLIVGFYHPSLLPFAPPTGNQNTVLWKNELGEKFTVIGEGAGARPTTGQMICDAFDLLKLDRSALG